MQRAKRVFVICVLVLCLNGAAKLHAEDSPRQSKAEVTARKTAAAKAVTKAKATAKSVQKAQQNAAASRATAGRRSCSRAYRRCCSCSNLDESIHRFESSGRSGATEEARSN